MSEEGINSHGEDLMSVPQKRLKKSFASNSYKYF